jgi:uncharacterized protein YfaS (alpha-2-macroglobulin family)
MDTSYELTLAPDLRNAQGQPVRARLHKTLLTPPFSVASWVWNRGSSNASSMPEIKLVFNATVQASAAARFLEFCDSKGRRVTAEVRQGTGEDRLLPYEFEASNASAWRGMNSMRTWNEQFLDRQPNPLPPTLPTPEVEQDPFTNEVANLLIVYPRTNLPIGKGWKLVMASGIPSSEGRFRLRQREEVMVGDVTPFAFVSATPRNLINHTPSITLEFSKQLDLSLTNDWPDYLEVVPSPTNLFVDLRGRTLVLQGKFRSDTNYIITVRAGLPAEEPFTLGTGTVYNIQVPKVAPRLYFPAFGNAQLAHGSRTFPLLAVNVPKVHLRAKLLDPQTVSFALRGYDRYFRGWDERSSQDEPFRRVDYSAVPGRTVFNETLPGGAELDEPSTLNLNWDTLLGGRKTGLVFLDAERQADDSEERRPLGTQALIQLTDLGVVWKMAPAQVHAFVFSHRTGEPLSGAQVQLLTDENQPLFAATTGKDGIVQLPASTNVQWLAVRLGEDCHVLELCDHKIPLYSFQLPLKYPWQGDDNRRVLLFSDREVYRPGETVQLKALVRDWSDKGLSVPTNLSGTLVCTDARERKFFETNLTFSSFGSCAAAVGLRPDSRGGYNAVLRFGEQEYSYDFQVQDFQPGTFEIELAAKPAYGPDEPIRVPISAHYFFGKSLSRAQAKWSLDAGPAAFKPAPFDGFDFTRCPIEERFGRGFLSLSLNGEEQLSTNSSICPDLGTNGISPGPQAISLLVEVTDINQQTLTRRAEFLRHSSDFYLGIRQTGNVQRVGVELPVEIVALGCDGKPWPKAVKAQLTLQRIDWQPIRIGGAGNSMRFRHQPAITNVAELTMDVPPVQLPTKPEEGVTGALVKGLMPTQAGQYLLEATASDSQGRPVVSSIEFTVSAEEQVAWDYRNDVQMSLKPSRTLYAPDDTAEILVQAPFSGQALVSVERDTVRRSFATKLEGNAPVLRVPLEQGDAPNVFISVTLVRGSEACPLDVKEPEYRIGYCQLQVKDPQHRLEVKLHAPETNCLPAQPVSVTVDVKDSQGAAVRDAEVVLYAVDEGILSLSGTEVPDPYSFFYTTRPLGVESSISLPGLLTEDPEGMHFPNKGYMGGGGGGERLRRNFLACAFWQADLVTDASGQVHATFPAPDSLTRYRIVAVAHTRENQFGSAQSAFQVSKPLVVEPALPRFGNFGDRLVARAVVQNQTTNSGKVEVTLELDACAKPSGISTSLIREVAVAANGFAVVEFPIEFVDTGIAQWKWKTRFVDAHTGWFTDAVLSTLDVGYPAPLLRQILATKVEAGEVDLLSSANPQLVEGQGAITVELANTRLVGLGESISELLHYPYGCAEQTSSSLLPWVLLHHKTRWMPLLGRGTNNAEKAITAGVARLFSMQTRSGGLSYWPRETEPMFWASAYGGLVLALAQRNDVPLPKESFTQLFDYLSAGLRSEAAASARAEDLCLAAYALAVAGRPEPAYHEKLFASREHLSREGRALLSLAICESHGPRAMATELLASAAAAEPDREDPFSGPARQKAIHLLATLYAFPGDARIGGLVDELMSEQKEGQWVTTQGNAWALLALLAYSEREEGMPTPCSGELRWGSETIAFRLEGTTNIFARAFPLARAQGGQSLKLMSSSGAVYANTSISARPRELRQPRQDQGLGLARTYQRLTDDNQAVEAKDLHVGDRVLVTLNIEARHPARFVAVDDALPASLEAINPSFKNQEVRGAPVVGSSPSNKQEDWDGDFREMRTDRVLFFANDLMPGNYVIRYLARVRAAATVTAPSAKVEEMYHPDRYGLSGAQTLTSQPFE